MPKNLVKQILQRKLGKIKNINYNNYKKIDENFCLICKASLFKNNKIKKSFGCFCMSCGLASAAVAGEYHAVLSDEDFNYVQYLF